MNNCTCVQVNDVSLIDEPHRTAVYHLRKIKPSERANLVIRRKVKIEEYKVSFDKVKEDTILGLEIASRPLPFNQVCS